MTNPYGGPGQIPTQSSTAHAAYWSPPTGATRRRTAPANRLVWAVVLLGLATYLVSCFTASPAGDTGWVVRFSVLAAVTAALGLFLPHSAQITPITALAIMGFLEAMLRLFTAGHHPSWATIVVAVLNALQSVAAFAAFLAQREVTGTTGHELSQYEAYVYYAQLAQQYYAAHAYQQQEQQAQATAQAEAAARARPAAPPRSAEQAEAQRDALYAEYLGAPEFNTSSAYLSPQTGRRSSSGQPAAGTDLASASPGQYIRPKDDPTTGSPTPFSS